MSTLPELKEQASKLFATNRASCVLIVVAIFAVFLQTTQFSFLDWDDPYMVTANDHIRHGISIAGLKWLPSGIIAYSWHPLTNLSWMIDAQLWGNWAGGFHLTNVFLHCIASLLVWRVFLALGLTPLLALAGAVLFAVHPLRVEPVAWITGRKDVMVGLWTFASLLAYLRYRQLRNAGNYLLVTVAVMCATLSKPIAIILVPMMVWIDLAAPAPRLSSDDTLALLRRLLARLPEKLPWALITLAPAVQMWSQHVGAGAVLTPFSGSLFDRIAYPLLATGEYLRLSVWPSGLQYLHPMWQDYGAAQLALACGAIIAISAFVWSLRHKVPLALFGWGWFLLSLAPGSGIVQVGHHAVAERYTYIPHVGLILAVIALLYWLARKYSAPKNNALSIALASMTIVSTAIAYGYTTTWSSSMTLRERALAVTGDHLNASRWMATTLANNGDMAGARVHAERIRTMKNVASDAEIALTLGEIYAAVGPPGEASAWLERATLLAPTQHAVWMSRAMFHLNERKFPEAAEHFRRVIELNPQFVHAWIGLGYSLIYLNQRDEAEQALKRAIQINPSLEQPYFHLAVLSEMQGNASAAIAYYRQALNLNPWHTAATRRLKRLEGMPIG